jgi:ankyrin repeat protein
MDWDSELLEAAVDGNLVQFRNAYAHGADINVKNIYGQSALTLAAEHYNKNIVGSILFLHQAGISVELNTQCNAGYTPLMLATINSDKKMVEMLLPFLTAKQLMTRDMAGATALMWAAEKGDTDTFKMIISSLNDKKECIAQQLDAQDGLDYTCLMHAAEKGNTNIVFTLIHDLGLNSKNLDKQNCWGQTAANLAAENGHIHIFKLLRAGTDLNLGDNNGKTPLEYLEDHPSEINPEPLNDDADSLLAELMMRFEFTTPPAPPAEMIIFSNRPPMETKEDTASKSERRRSRLPNEEMHHRPNKKTPPQPKQKTKRNKIT